MKPKNNFRGQKCNFVSQQYVISKSQLKLHSYYQHELEMIYLTLILYIWTLHNEVSKKASNLNLNKLSVKIEFIMTSASKSLSKWVIGSSCSMWSSLYILQIQVKRGSQSRFKHNKTSNHSSWQTNIIQNTYQRGWSNFPDGTTWLDVNEFPLCAMALFSLGGWAPSGISTIGSELTYTLFS